MNILFILGTFPTYSETFIVNQIIGLQDAGHRVYIYSVKEGSKKINNELIGGIKHRVFYSKKKGSRIEKLVYFIKIICLVPFKVKIKALLRPRTFFKKPLYFLEDYIDVVHCHFAPNALYFIEKYLEKGYFEKAKKINTFHGYDMSPHQVEDYKMAYARIYQIFDAFTYNTPYLGNVVRQTSQSIKLFELPMGFNRHFLQKFYNTTVKNTRFTVVFCGRLIALKGVRLLPEIIDLVVQEDKSIQFSIIGDGELKETLRQKLADKNLMDNVRLYGYLNQNDVFKEMNQSHLLIMPGIQEPETQKAETQGLVIQEAQFFGLPVIVSDVGGMKYGMLDQETGYVIEQGDVVGFAKAILDLKNNNSLYHKMSKRAREFAIDSYSIEKLNQKLIGIYSAIVSREGGDWVNG